MIMASLTFTTSRSPVPSLQLTAKELEKAGKNSAVDAARRLQTVGRANLVKSSEISKSSAVRRVRRYGTKVWFGTDPVVETAPRLVYRRVTKSHRGLILDGAHVPLGFALNKDYPRYGNLPFVRESNGGLRVLRRDISDHVSDAWIETSAEVEAIYQEEMDKRAARVVRTRR